MSQDRKRALRRLVMLCLCTSAFVPAAFSAVIDYPDGSNNATPIVLTDNTTQLQVLVGSATQSGQISESGGSFGLEKIGAGTLVVTGGNGFGQNIYNGTTTISAGTLQLGDGGTTGAIVGPIVNNATLILNYSNTALNAFSFQPISGSGSVVKMGTGTAILSGVNTYTGGTTISAGTLQIGSDDSTSSITGDVLDNANITFKRNGIYTFAGVISGAGSLTQSGSGQLVLTGASTYSGGTTVAGGSLVVGDGGTSGSIAGNVSVGLGTLIFRRSDTYVFSGNISQAGGGSLKQSGTGTLVLTGDVDSNTTVESGVLQIGNGGTRGSITGGVNTSASVVFNRSDTATLDTTISGSGSVTISGSGTTVLLGALNQTGGTTISNGTLQLGNGGPTGYVPGNILDNSRLVFNRSDSFTFSGIVSGTGSVEKAGTGTVTLTGANTYTGGTTLTSGVLQLGTGGSLASTGILSFGGGKFDLNGKTQTVGGLSNANLSANSELAINGGSLTVNQTTDIAIAAKITGGGTFIYNGPATLTINALGTNFSGNVTVNGGNVSIASPFGLDFSGGNLTINGGAFSPSRRDLNFAMLSGTGGTLNLGGSNISFTSNADSTFAGSIVDIASGRITKAGTGTLTLTGTSSAPANIVINGGTLQFGKGGVAGGFVYASLVNNGQFVVNRSDNLTLTGATSGTGSLTKQGTGTLTLVSGTMTYTGPTTVSGGTLLVSNSIASSKVTVANGATLTGTGTVGATTIASGGTLTPGDPTAGAKLTVSGNLALASGANYTANIAPASANLASVSGAASLNGGVTANFSSGTYTAGQSFTLINAAGGVSGTFATLTSNGVPSYVKPRLSYDANNVYLNLDASALGVSADANANTSQGNVTTAVNNVVAGGTALPTGFAALYSLSGTALNSAVDQISGQVGSNVANSVGQGSLSFMSLSAPGGGSAGGSFAPGSAYNDAGAPRRAKLGAGETRLWGAVYGGHVGLASDAASGAAGLSANNVGMIGGADLQLGGGLLIGASAGFGRQDFRSGNGTGSSDDIMVGLYARADADRLYVTAAVGLGWHQVTTQRTITVSGTDVLQGKQDAKDYGGRLEAGWRASSSRNPLSLSPYAAVALDRFETPAYAETVVSGSSTFALSYAAHTSTLGRSELGLRLDRDYQISGGLLAAAAHAAWAHRLGDTPFTQASFQALPTASFVVRGVRPDSETGLLGLDLDLKQKSGLFFGVSGEAQVGKRTTILQGMGHLGWRW